MVLVEFSLPGANYISWSHAVKARCAEQRTLALDCMAPGDGYIVNRENPGERRIQQVAH